MGILMIVPTLGRRPDLLGLSLDSITSQDVIDLDVAVVAPAERGVEEIARAYGARFVPDPGVGGISGALNAGLAAAKPGTSYVAWLGDDDVLSPGSLRRTAGVLDEHADAAMAFGWCDYIDERGQVVFRSRAGRIAAWILGWGPNLVPQPGSLMRYDDVVAVGGLDESIRLALDLDLFLRLRRRGRLVAVPETLASFRWHADSATVKGANLSMEESDRIRMRYMHPLLARAYLVLRWPGRLLLWLAKRKVDRNSAAVERAR